MPYIAQCPHEDCLKYMLLEDEKDPGTSLCLVCRRVMTVGATTPMDEDELLELTPSASLQGKSAKKTPAAPKFLVKSCPKCGTPLRVKKEDLRNAIQCTDCNFWGLVR